MPARILLIRHGETEANAAGVLQGQSESALTARGRAQANALGVALRAKLHALGQAVSPIIWTSDLSRAVDTAQAVVRNVDAISSLRTDERLRERLLGPFQGISTAECAARYPKAWAAFNRGELDDGEPTAALEPGAADAIERVGAMQERCLAALNDVADAGPGATTLVVSHGGLVYTAVVAVRGEGDSSHVPHIGNVSVTTLQRSEGGTWQVVQVGEVLVDDAATSASRNVDMAAATNATARRVP